MSYGSFRQACYKVLHTPADATAKMVDGMIALLIILTIAAIPLHFIPALSWAQTGLFWFEAISVFLFTIEYIVRVWSYPKPMHYLFSWFGIIDLAAIAPFYLALFGIIHDPEIFLVLRLLRLLKLAKIYHSERVSMTHIAKKQHGDFRVLPDEHIEDIVHKHPLIFLFTLIPPLIGLFLAMLTLLLWYGNPFGISFSILFFVFSILFFIKSWLDFHYDVIYITNHRLIVQNRQLFGCRMNDVSYESITNIKPDNTGILRFLLGFGDIHIETAAATGNQKFTNAIHPHEAVRKISQNRQESIEHRTLRKEHETAKNPIQDILDASQKRQREIKG